MNLVADTTKVFKNSYEHFADGISKNLTTKGLKQNQIDSMLLFDSEII